MGALIPRKRESRITILVAPAEVSVATDAAASHLQEIWDPRDAGEHRHTHSFNVSGQRKRTAHHAPKALLPGRQVPRTPVPANPRRDALIGLPPLSAHPSIVPPSLLFPGDAPVRKSCRVVIHRCPAKHSLHTCTWTNGSGEAQLLPSSDSQSLIPATMNAHPVTCHPIVISLSNRAVRSPTNLKVSDQRKRTPQPAPKALPPGRQVPPKALLPGRPVPPKASP
jgi:hypothetical protein